MKILNEKELNSLKTIFKLEQSHLFEIMYKYLQKKYTNILIDKKYIIAVGDIPIGLVAHLDTVFNRPPIEFFYDKEKNVIWSPQGLGADDRAGVYSIIQIIEKGYLPTIILTKDEEAGCLGSKRMVKKIPTPPTKLKYIIQLDRQGKDDCVFYNCNNLIFNDYIKKFDFKIEFGSFSDISEICPVWGVAGVNLSIGYKYEHSFSELLYVDHMYNTIYKVENMLKDVDNIDFFDYIDKNCNKLFGELVKQCHQCSTTNFDFNLFPVKDENEETIFLCVDCMSKIKNLNWCIKCGEPFIDKNLSINDIAHCKKCRGKN